MMKFCSNCGNDIEGMRFCSECGFEVSENPGVINEVHEELPPYENKFGSFKKKTIKIEDEVLYINKTKLRLYDINVVYHISPGTLTLGYIYFSSSGQPPKNAKEINNRGFHYSVAETDKAEELLDVIYMVDHIEMNLDYTSIQDMLKSITQPNVVTPVAPVVKERTYLSKSFKCPRCKSPNIQLMDTGTNIKKVKNTTSINLNPLKPFTVFNHKEKKKKKRSKGKLAVAALTGGASLFVTGTKDNKGSEYHCADCGKRWNTK